MAKKKSNKSGFSIVFGAIIVFIGFILYALTGVDLLGVNTTDNGGTPPIVATSPRTSTGDFVELDVVNGFGYQSDFWQLYFTAPLNTRDRSQYVNGIDVNIAAAIDATNNTLDIAAFELNNEVITQAILDAHNRGVTVRIVADNEHGVDDDDTTLNELQLAGIPIVDDARTGLMHNKFMIMDGITVWLGSMNYTTNGVYRNNNNAIAIRSRRAVNVYQEEFEEMFTFRDFGIRSDPFNTGEFSQSGTPIEVYFASENNVANVILREIDNAQTSIHFMAFAFTLNNIGDAMIAQAEAGLEVQGVFETTGSETIYSEMPRLFCAGVDVRQDGNNGILHHKVIIIDESTVITGSFNFSANAGRANDENIMIIRNEDLANLYMDEFLRVQSIATPSDDVRC